MNLGRTVPLRIWLALWLLLLTGGCGPAPDPQVIRMGLATVPVNLDPRFATDAVSARVTRLLYRSLVEFDAADRPIPGLADWTQPAPDWYRFRLLPDAPGRLFDSGRRLTSEDVRATLAALLDPATGSPFRAQLALVARMEVLDPDRIDFHLTRPDPLFPTALTLAILPADLLVQGHPFSRDPQGSGPLRLRDWPEPGRLVLERRADGQILELVEAKDPGVRAMKLLRGEIDLIQGELPPELFRLLGERPDLRVERAPGSNFSYLGLNLEDPALANPLVRRALAHAIDRDAIIHYVLGNGASAAEALFRPQHWAGHPDLPPYPHDPDLARRLLQEAGHGPDQPLQLEFKTSTDPFRVRLATIIQAQLAAVGVRLGVRSLDWGTFYGDVKAGRFQVFSLTWVGVRTPDQFRYLFHSGSLPPDGANRGRYANPQVDSLIAAAETLPTLEQQAPLYRQLQELLHQDLPYLPLWYEDQILARRQDLHGYRLSPDGSLDGLVRVWRTAPGS